MTDEQIYPLGNKISKKMFVNLLLVPGKLGNLTFLPTDINLSTV